MIDVFIPLRYANSSEIEYTLRGIKNLDNIGTVYIVGADPKIAEPAVPYTHVRQLDYSWRKRGDPFSDVDAKFQSLVDQYDLSDEFYLFNDDFFVMHPTDVPVGHKGLISEQIQSRGNRSDYYTRALRHTLEYLRTRGIEEPLSYELHIPMLMSTGLRRMYAENMRRDVMLGKSLLIRSIYGNLEKIGGNLMEDVKDCNAYRDMIFLSTTEVTFNGEIGKYIRSVL